MYTESAILIVYFAYPSISTSAVQVRSTSYHAKWFILRLLPEAHSKISLKSVSTVELNVFDLMVVSIRRSSKACATT